MTLEERILDCGYENVRIFANPSYETAFIGVSEDNRAVYDYNLMVEYLVANEEMSIEEAVEWIDYNTLRALPYWGNEAPVVVYPVP